MSAVGLIGAAVSIFGSVMAFNSQQDMVNKQTKISKASENVRAQQMMLDAQRRKRQALRSALAQRALAQSNGVTQGAGTNSSGVQGGEGAATAAGLEGQQTTNSSSILGLRQFKNNRDYFDATQSGQFWTSLWQGVAGAGQVAMGNAGQITSLGEDWFKKPAGPTGSAFTGGWGSGAFA